MRHARLLSVGLGLLLAAGQSASAQFGPGFGYYGWGGWGGGTTVGGSIAQGMGVYAAGLGQFAQPEYLDATAAKLELTADQKKEFQKIEAEYAPKLEKLGTQLADQVRTEREAMNKVLTEDQRARWTAL